MLPPKPDQRFVSVSLACALNPRRQMAELNKKRPQFAEASFANFNAIVCLLLSLRFAAGGRHGSHFLAVRSLDAGGFALQVAQVIQPCPSNFTFADDFNRADRGRV